MAYPKLNITEIELQKRLKKLKPFICKGAVNIAREKEQSPHVLTAGGATGLTKERFGAEAFAKELQKLNTQNPCK